MQKKVVRPWAAALAVVFMLSMLAPAAMAEPAAPDFVHGVNIVSPTELHPEFLEEEGDRFDLVFDVAVTGQQVVEVEVEFFLREGDGLEWLEVEPEDLELDPQDFTAPVTRFTARLRLDDTDDVEDDGWYDLRIVVTEDQADIPFVDVEESAVLVDGEEPTVDLDRPSDDNWMGLAFVTGNQYVLQGTAQDNVAWVEGEPSIAPLGFFTVAEDGHDSVEFQIQYCDEWNDCRWEDDWVRLDVRVRMHEDLVNYSAVWDSSTVPDTEDEWYAMIRMCAWDRSENSNCEEDGRRGRGRAEALRDGQQRHNPWEDTHWVDIDNYFEIDMQNGWNLISLPIAPYNPDITDVLKHINSNVLMVATWNAQTSQWDTYTGGATPPTVSALTQMTDGPGYWVKMDRESDLELWIRGTWGLNGNGMSFPRTIPVYGTPQVPAWNLIGYTQFGKPTWMDPEDVGEYLGPHLYPAAQVMYRYDAELDLFRRVDIHDRHEEEDMRLGSGYILASTATGMITP